MKDKHKEKETLPDLAVKYYDEFREWLNTLRSYHTERFNRNYKQYTAYATTMGTESKISDPAASEMIERVVQRLFERDPKFNVDSRGVNLPKEVRNIIVGAIDYMWGSPEAIEASGTMRSRLQVIGREFLITGNVAVETFYNSESDLPDVQLIPIEDVIFDPAKSLKTSKVIYVRKFVSLNYLKDNQEIVRKDGLAQGLFKNIDKVLVSLKDFDQKTNDTTDNQIMRSGSDNYTAKRDPIQLITRYEGKKVCRFVVGQDTAITVQEFENEILEDDPIDVAMDIEVPKEPYAFGLLDFLIGNVKLADLFTSQLSDYGSKVLNPPLFVDPSLAPVNRATLRNAWRLGGLVYAPPQQADHKPMPSLGSFPFDMLNYLQQRREGASGIGAYLGGVPNQASDKTQGTKGGILALQSEAVTPVKDRQQKLEEAIIQPVINKWIKIKGALMRPGEIKDVLISGASPKWVKITKGMLTGKMTLYDLRIAELINDQEMEELEAYMLEQRIFPDEELVVDTDWLVSVETGSMAEANREQDLNNFNQWVAANLQYGIPMDMQKISIENGIRAGIKDPEQYISNQPNIPNQPMGQQTQGLQVQPAI